MSKKYVFDRNLTVIDLKELLLTLDVNFLLFSLNFGFFTANQLQNSKHFLYIHELCTLEFTYDIFLEHT